MKFYYNRSKKLVSIGILSFLLGYMMCFIYHDVKQVFAYQNIQEHDVIILILSSPNNFRQRNTIRRTWLQLMNKIDYDAFETTLEYMDVPNFNKRGFLVKDSIYAQTNRLIKYKSKIVDRVHKQKNNKAFKRKPFSAKYLFSVGTKDLPLSTMSHITRENDKHDDLLILSSLQDSYGSLTEKIIKSFTAIGGNFNFKYILKCDDDSYAHLNTIIEELEAYDSNLISSYQNQSIRPQLYWGYFHGAAKVKQTGPWAESDWFTCDRYLPYALGGGYVLSNDLVKYIIDNANILSKYRSEDVSVGTWLAPLRNVYRRHDPRFNTQWKPRPHHLLHTILHKITPEAMDRIWAESNMDVENSSTENLGYYYNWEAYPSMCCIK